MRAISNESYLAAREREQARALHVALKPSTLFLMLPFESEAGILETVPAHAGMRARDVRSFKQWNLLPFDGEDAKAETQSWERNEGARKKRTSLFRARLVPSPSNVRGEGHSRTGSRQRQSPVFPIPTEIRRSTRRRRQRERSSRAIAHWSRHQSRLSRTRQPKAARLPKSRTPTSAPSSSPAQPSRERKSERRRKQREQRREKGFAGLVHVVSAALTRLTHGLSSLISTTTSCLALLVATTTRTVHTVISTFPVVSSIIFVASLVGQADAARPRANAGQSPANAAAGPSSAFVGAAALGAAVVGVAAAGLGAVGRQPPQKGKVAVDDDAETEDEPTPPPAKKKKKVVVDSDDDDQEPAAPPPRKKKQKTAAVSVPTSRPAPPLPSRSSRSRTSTSSTSSTIPASASPSLSTSSRSSRSSRRSGQLEPEPRRWQKVQLVFNRVKKGVIQVRMEATPRDETLKRRYELTHDHPRDDRDALREVRSELEAHMLSWMNNCETSFKGDKDSSIELTDFEDEMERYLLDEHNINIYTASAAPDLPSLSIETYQTAPDSLAVLMPRWCPTFKLVLVPGDVREDTYPTEAERDELLAEFRPMDWNEASDLLKFQYIIGPINPEVAAAYYLVRAHQQFCMDGDMKAIKAYLLAVQMDAVVESKLKSFKVSLWVKARRIGVQRAKRECEDHWFGSWPIILPTDEEEEQELEGCIARLKQALPPTTDPSDIEGIVLDVMGDRIDKVKQPRNQRGVATWGGNYPAGKQQHMQRLFHAVIREATRGQNRSAPTETADLLLEQIKVTTRRLISGAQEAADQLGLSFVSGLSGFPLGFVPWEGIVGAKLPEGLRKMFSIDHIFQFSAIYRASQQKLEKFMHGSLNFMLVAHVENMAKYRLPPCLYLLQLCSTYLTAVYPSYRPDDLPANAAVHEISRRIASFFNRGWQAYPFPCEIPLRLQMSLRQLADVHWWNGFVGEVFGLHPHKGTKDFLAVTGVPTQDELDALIDGDETPGVDADRIRPNIALYTPISKPLKTVLFKALKKVTREVNDRLEERFGVRLIVTKDGLISMNKDKDQGAEEILQIFSNLARSSSGGGTAADGPFYRNNVVLAYVHVMYVTAYSYSQKEGWETGNGKSYYVTDPLYPTIVYASATKSPFLISPSRINHNFLHTLGFHSDLARCLEEQDVSFFSRDDAWDPAHSNVEYHCNTVNMVQYTGDKAECDARVALFNKIVEHYMTTHGHHLANHINHFLFRPSNTWTREERERVAEFEAECEKRQTLTAGRHGHEEGDHEGEGTGWTAEGPSVPLMVDEYVQEEAEAAAARGEDEDEEGMEEEEGSDEGAGRTLRLCIAPLISDQSPVKRQTLSTLPSGERVIIDPGVTITSMLLIYYWSVNVGSFFQICTSYAEKLVGFWLAWLIPTILYLLMPICLFYMRNKLVMIPPQGSVVLDAGKIIKTAFSGAGKKQFFARDTADAFWNKAKPTELVAAGEFDKKGATYFSWDDDFVDEVRRTAYACKVFLWAPIFHISAGGLDSVINSMASTMRTDGVPNDIFQNFNSLTLIIFVPLANWGLYPALRKAKIDFGPIRRICVGFLLATMGMIYGAILQWKVYETSPCGYSATTCEIGTKVSPLRVWLQVPIFMLPAGAEIFINISMYEIAYTRAPQRMKGVVFAIVLFMSSLSAALTLIITPAFHDPNLIWPFVGVACATFVSSILIFWRFRHMDYEDELIAIGADRKIEGMDGGRPTKDVEVR